MLVLYCPTGTINSAPIQLFAELADVEPVADVTLLNQHTFVGRLEIDLNVGSEEQYGGTGT